LPSGAKPAPAGDEDLSGCRAALASPLTIACSRAQDNYASICSAPREHWGRVKDGIGHLRTMQPIYVASDGSTLWNKVVISDATLRNYMSVMSGINPEPQAVLDIAPTAACNRVEAVRTIMDAAPMCKGRIRYAAKEGIGDSARVMRP